MPTIAKWIITIAVVLFGVYVYRSNKLDIPYWIAALFACALFGLWMMEDMSPRKKKLSFEKQKRKTRLQNIFLLIVIVIIIIVILKFTG